MRFRPRHCAAILDRKVTYDDRGERTDQWSGNEIAVDFRSKGGREHRHGGGVQQENSFEAIARYDATVNAKQRIQLDGHNGPMFEIVSVENIDMRSQFMRLELKHHGGANA